jgi:Flp pilus assembly protein TadD
MISPLRWVAITLLALPVMGDTLVLQDGSRLEGNLKRTPDGYELTDSTGKVRQIKASEVASISVGKTDPGSAASAKDRLASLKRSVEQLSDLDQIIERFNRFIEQTSDEVVKSDAKKELDQWQARKEKGLVKISGRWVTPEERDKVIASAAGTAEQAREALQQNRNKDAEQLIRQTLEIDPGNTVALYLQGVLLYRQNKFPLARRSFESVAETLSEHAATLNNIAVILVQQKETIRAMPFFDRAMLGMPDNKYILGNVLETLMMLPENQQKNAAVVKVQKRFLEQDARLSQKMAQYGWYRWGSIWVDQAKLDQLKKEEAEVKARMDSLQKEFDAAETRLREITGRIDGNERFMFDIRQRSTYRDANGNLIRVPYPQSYYDAEADNQRLVVERTTVQQEQNVRRQRAQQMKRELPSAKFSGVLHLIEVEGAPDGPAAPATAPAVPETSPSSKAPTTQGEGPF